MRQPFNIPLNRIIWGYYVPTASSNNVTTISHHDTLNKDKFSNVVLQNCACQISLTMSVLESHVQSAFQAPVKTTMARAGELETIERVRVDDSLDGEMGFQ